MKTLSYIHNKFFFNRLSKAFSLGCLTFATCFLSSVAHANNPTPDWTINSTVNDCSFPLDSSNSSCQSYQDDLYENWYSGDQGSGDTDIKTFSVGADDEYFYFQLDLRDDWDSDNDGESREYYLEIEADGDTQSDFFLVYKPKRDDLSANWYNKGNSGEVEVYQDSNNDIGGNDAVNPDSNSDGYESDLSSGKHLRSGDFYVRLVDGNIQIALKKSVIGTTDNILVRAYAAQNTNLEPSKLTWHDYNSQSDLAGSGGFDNTAGADVNTWLWYNSANSVPTPNSNSSDSNNSTNTSIIYAD